MADAGVAYIDFEPRFGNLNAEVAARMRTVSSTMQSHVASGLTPNKSTLRNLGSNLTSNFTSFGKKAGKALGIGLAAGAVGVGFALKGAVDAARESQKIGRETERVIKSMGGVANVSAKDVGRLADQMARRTGIDDELIQSGANVMLTFGNIRNEVGKGNDVFNQGVGIANDMSVALGQDMQSSVVQVGKALNDPIKGVTALGRVGVQFTEDQKAQIKTLVESGDTLGAQKVILNELGREFKGAAETAATPMDKLKVVLGNLQEQIGAWLIPMIDKAANAFLDFMPTVERIAGGFKAFFGAFMNAEDGVTSSGFAGTMEQIAITLRGAWDTIYSVVEPVFGAIIGFFQKNPDVLFGSLAVVVGGVLISAIVGMGLALWGALTPVVLIIGAIALLVGGVIYAYQNFQWFKDGVNASWQFIQAAWNNVLRPTFEAVWRFIQDVLVPVFGQIWQVMQAAWNIVTTVVVWAWQTIILPLWNGIIAFVTGFLIPTFNTIWSTMQAVWNGVVAVVLWAWTTIILPLWTAIQFFINTILLPVFNAIWLTMQGVWNAIVTVIVLAWQLIQPIWAAIGFYIDNVLRPTFDRILSTAKAVWDGIWAAISTIWGTYLKPLWDGIIGFINDTFLPAFGRLRDVISRIWGQIKSTAKSVWDGIMGVIRDAINVGIRVINKLIDGVNLVVGIVPGVDKIDHIPELGANAGKPSGNRPTAGGGGANRLMADGGVVPYDLGRYGPMLTDGPRAIVGEGNQRHPEYVIPTDPKFRDRALAFTLAAARELGIPMHAAGTAGLQEPFKSNVEKVLAAGNGRISLASGFRSRAQQARLYQMYLNGTGNLAAPPGNSNHERGLAVDYSGPTSLYQGLAQMNGQHFPVRGEPWHAEPYDGGGVMGSLGRAFGGLVKGAIRGLIAAPMAAADGLINQIPVEFLRNFAKHAKTKVYDWLLSEDDKLPSGEGGGGSGASVPAGLLGGPAAAIGKSMAASRGWTGAQWDALNQLWTKESGWNVSADNPSSSAYGIPQALPGSKMASHGGDWRTNPATQIAWGLDYIAGRYGTPSSAWAHSQRHNWYAKGGVLPASIHANSFDSGGVLAPGWNVVRNDTGADELVRPQNGAGGPLVNIENAQFNDPVDVDVLDQKLGMLVAMGSA